MPLSEFSAPSPGMPTKENVAAGRSQPSVTIEHESLPGLYSMCGCQFYPQIWASSCPTSGTLVAS
jgi:hypothetical protein